MFADGEMPILEQLQGFPIAFRRERFDLAESVSDEAEFSGRSDFGIKLFESSHREITGIFVNLLLRGLALGVDLLKDGAGHIDFAADLQNIGNVIAGKP